MSYKNSGLLFVQTLSARYKLVADVRWMEGMDNLPPACACFAYQTRGYSFLFDIIYLLGFDHFDAAQLDARSSVTSIM